MPLESKCLISF